MLVILVPWCVDSVNDTPLQPGPSLSYEPATHFATPVPGRHEIGNFVKCRQGDSL